MRKKKERKADVKQNDHKTQLSNKTMAKFFSIEKGKKVVLSNFLNL